MVVIEEQGTFVVTDREMEDWITADDNLRDVHDDETQSESDDKTDTDIEEQDPDDGVDALIRPTFVEVTEALNVIRRFELFHQIHCDTGSLCDHLERQAFADDVAARKQKTKMTYYFSPVVRPVL